MGSTRTKLPALRSARPVHAAAGALMLAVPSSAVALATSPGAPAQPLTPNIESFKLRTNHIRYGHRVAVSGVANPSAARQHVELQLASAIHPAWKVISSGVIGTDGHFRLGAPMRRSGQLRVIGTPSAATAPAPAPTTSTASVVLSPEKHVAVTAQLRLHTRSIGVLGGQVARVRGRLLPGVAGRRVALELRSGGRWHAVAHARTGARGGFNLRFAPPAGGTRKLRVRFAGDRVNTGTSTRAGTVTVFSPTLVSWYSDGGSTACGFHAYYGVANKSLPCGTKVTFRSGGRSVTATVDDRGPYVGGREYDLNQNTAAALGFGGVGSMWASVL
jgi:rare lipoprotein A